MYLLYLYHFHLSFSQLLRCSLLPLNSWCLLFLILNVMDANGKHTQTYRHEHTYTTYWFYSCCSWVLVFRADHLTLDKLSAGSSLEKIILPLSAAINSSPRNGILWHFLHQCWHVLVWLFSFYLENHIIEISWVYLSCHLEKILTGSKYDGPPSITIFPTLFHDVPELSVKGSHSRCIIWSWASLRHFCSLHF